jgi:hypothetical protein
VRKWLLNLWGDATMDLQILPWRRVVDRADALPLALDIAGTPRRVSGDTGIGRGLMAALDLLEARPSCAARRIVNVSGGGRESYGPRQRPRVSLAVARDRAIRMGVTVNGLAITVEAPDLAEWYRDWVITGPGGFVMTVGWFEAFGEAIIRKLERELSLPIAASETARDAVR